MDHLSKPPTPLQRCVAWGWMIISLWLFHVGLPGVEASAKREDRVTKARSDGKAAFEKGAFEQAAAQWKLVVDLERHEKDQAGLVDSLIDLGSAYHAMGQHRRAVDALLEARDLAEKRHDRPRQIAALNLLGTVRTFSHEAEFARGHFDEALKLARQTGDRVAQASVQNNLGILLAGQGSYPEAMAAYREAAELAADPVLVAKAKANLAETSVQAADFAHAAELNESALAAAAHLPDSHDKAFCLTRGGKTWELIFEQDPAHEQKHRAQALQAYEDAARTAEAVNDPRALAYALGYSGHLYEQEKKYDTAMKLTRRAAFLAQQAQSPDSLYLWEWQTGRIDSAENRRDDAVADYHRAVHNLDLIRNDLSSHLGNANARSSFRQAAGSVYFELADLLLQRADGMHDEKEIERCMKEARDTCETLKSVELEDYFQDDCVNLLRTKTKGVEAVSPTAAIIYLIPLKGRTEILVSIGPKLERVKASVGAEELTGTVHAFRVHLETRATDEYFAEAAQIYNWLIRPLDALLEKSKIDTLVFVPDGALRTIPMAALYDGEKFLVQKYAIAITPGLTLMEPKPIKRTNIAMLANGLTEAVQREGQSFPALPNVKDEIATLHKLYGGTTLMNSDFRVANVEKAFAGQPFSVVHIASHGEFSGDVRKTFVLTYDGVLTLDGLEHLIRPSQLREQPLELLSLSACETAAGDDRAALGLAGVAVKAGARSAFATLWCVNDVASNALIADFYGGLQKDSELSKAKALQRAQVKLLSQPLTSHPCYWAPYLIIGNWL